MEEQKKNPLGNIYGSRVSKNGKWLNLLIVTHVDGREIRITCPVRIATDYDDVGGKKPYARLEKACNADGAEYIEKAAIENLPVYEDRKPTEAQAAAEDSDLPF